jgi:hypothetical protein
MVYYVFDLDNTIGDFYSTYFLVSDLRSDTVSEHRQTILKPPEEVIPNIRKAYKYFVHQIALREKSDKPIGLLRPGIIDIMKMINLQKFTGICKGVVLYSNNGNLETLEFARDIIHDILQTHTLILDCIHLYHPFRKSEVRKINENASPKKWATIQKILTEGKCKAINPKPEEVVFFDDVLHSDIVLHLNLNYITFRPYIFKPSFDYFADLYLKALEHADIKHVKGDVCASENYIVYMAYLGIISETNAESLENHIEVHRSNTPDTAPLDTVPPNDMYGTELMRKRVMRYNSKKIMDTFDPKIYLDEINDIMNSLKITYDSDTTTNTISEAPSSLQKQTLSDISGVPEKYDKNTIIYSHGLKNQGIKIKPTRSLSDYLHSKPKKMVCPQSSIYPIKSMRSFQK